MKRSQIKSALKHPKKKPLHMHVTQKFSFAKSALLHGSHTQDLPITFFSE